MKIAMINGSPKLKKSNSESLLKSLEASLPCEYEVIHYNLSKKPLTDEQYITLCHTDVMIFAFPLYIDAIPSHLFRMLIALEDYLKSENKKSISVYAIINNGFYEGQQNHIAINILENWCEHCGLHFGQGIGLGAGEMLGVIQNVPLGHGPLKNLGSAISLLTNNIIEQRNGESILFSPNFPYFAWHCYATSFWNSLGKQNHLKRKDIVRKL